MTIDSLERSEYGSKPIELYQFSRGATNWFYTSYASTVLFEGNNYQATQIKRSQIEGSQDLERTTLKITINREESLVSQFISQSPTDIIRLTLTRTHFGDPDSTIAWKGRLLNVKILNNVAELSLQSIYSSLKRPGLRRVYQVSCPHVLYGTQCAFDRAITNYSHTGVISSTSVVDGLSVLTSTAFQDGTITFPAGVPASFQDDWFVGGYIDFLKGGVVERRFISAYNKTTGQITINQPLQNLIVGSDTVTAYAGCDHALTTCAQKFNNNANYGGFPNIPTKNPMDGTSIF